MLWKYYPSSSDPATRAQAAEIIRQAAPYTASVGAKVILLPVGQPDDLTPERARDNLVNVLKECVPAAEAAGVVYAVENVGEALALTPEHLIEIVERVASPACQVYYDVGNAASQGADPVRDIAKLGTRIVMVHVKDRAVAGGKEKLAIIGEGRIDFAAAARALHAVGYDGYAVLEVPGTAETADGIAVRSREALRAAGF